MSESGLYPVQTWLWSELDDLGIDGVIYSRHILDLLISSKHTFDHRLEEKEQNIFSKISPGAKKRKHKYSRRSSSFSACEEILWKKEIAVSCLLSAAETKADAEDTQATIQQVVDELYSKLAGLHLTTDSRKAYSDESDYYLTDHNGNTVAEEKSAQKENYEDAFPSLDGSTGSPVPNSLSGSVWNKTEKKSENKSGRDSDNSLKAKPPHPSYRREPQFPRSSDGATKNKFSPNSGSCSEGELLQEPVKKPHSYPLCPRNRNRRYNNFKKPRAASTGCDDLNGSSSVHHSANKPPHPRHPQVRFQSKIKKTDSRKKKVSDKLSAQKRRYPNSKKVAEKPKGGSKLEDHKEDPAESEIQQDYAHLPSWMETTLADISTPYIWSSWDGFQNSNKEESTKEESADPPFSSRWYRDPDTGLLTFQPLKSSVDRTNSSSSSSTLSRPPSSLHAEEDEDDLFKEVELDNETPAAPESWMWCPSPSLWEEDPGQVSPVSRLQSVYKRELMSLGAENHADDISGRFWEEYKTIFLDLQEMDAGSDHESSEEEQSSNIWSSKENFPSKNLDCGEFSNPVMDNFKRAKFHTGTESVEREFDLWSDTVPPATVPRNSSFDSIASSSCIGEHVLPKSSSADSNIWKYTPVHKWSTEDGIEKSRDRLEMQPDEELAVLMQNGAFGYLCHGKMDGWNAHVPKEHPIGTLWGGGDNMPVLEKPDTPKETYEERMMHTLVDALFSDLSFDMLFSPNEDPEPLPGYRKVSRLTPSAPIDHDISTTLSFGFRSLVVQTPIENFHSPDNNPWQPRWDIDDLFSHAGFPHLSPFGKLDDLFMSLASAEELDRQYGRLSDTAQRKNTFLDSVTENEAWKTSLRIGNIWQSISGIRPVNVIYSENKPGPGPVEKLIPSSETHFRPISAPISCEENESPGIDTAMPDTPLMPEEPDYHTGQDVGQIAVPEMTNIEIEKYTISDPTEEPSFQMSFSKLVQDKSMQTAFEMAVQQDIPSCQQFVIPRPPKANSR